MRTLILLPAICLMLMANALQARTNPIPTNVGDMAPDIQLPDQYGNTLSLSSLKGNMVLVYFWASWEPNTDVIAPNLTILHQKYSQAQFNGNKGFSIYTVSLDSDPQAWHNALRHYNFPGKYHVNDFYSTYTSTYNFNKLPTHYLIDGSGKVVGINMTMAEIDRTLAANAALSQNMPNNNWQAVTTMPATMNSGGNWQPMATTTTSKPATYSNSTSNWTTVENTAAHSNKQAANDILPNRAPINAMPAQWTTVENTAIHTQKQRGALPTTVSDKWVDAENLPHASTGDVQASKANMAELEEKLKEKISNNTATSSNAPQTASETKTLPETFSTKATATKGSHYKIQLGAYKYLNSSDFDKAKPFGTLILEQAGSDVQRVLLGDYTDKINSVETLAKVRSAGYIDAFVMIYNGEKRVRPLTKEETLAIAKSKGINLLVAEEPVSDKTDKPLQMNVASIIEGKANTANKVAADQPLVTVKDTKVAADKPLVTVKDTKIAADQPLVTVKDTKAKASESNTNASGIDQYSVVELPTKIEYTDESVRQINFDERATSNQMATTNHAMPQTHTYYDQQQSLPQTYTAPTDPNLGNLSYGTISEAYTTPKQMNGGSTYYSSTNTTQPSTYSHSNSAMYDQAGNLTTYQNAKGVWVPLDIPVFNNATTNTNGNNANFDWYPELNSRSTAPNSNKTATPTTTPATKPATHSTTPPAKTSGNAPALEPTSDRARNAQNLANSQDTPARATAPSKTTTTTPATTTPTNTDKATTNADAAAKDKAADKATTPNPKALDSYIDDYLKDYEYSATKSSRLKAKEKRNKNKDKK
jgi:peroxiredoxin